MTDTQKEKRESPLKIMRIRREMLKEHINGQIGPYEADFLAFLGTHIEKYTEKWIWNKALVLCFFGVLFSVMEKNVVSYGRVSVASVCKGGFAPDNFKQ